MLPYIVMFFAGIGIPLMATLNAAMSAHLGNVTTATAILLIIACSTAMTIALAGGMSGIHRAPAAPKHLFVAGTLFVFYISTITWAAPRIGISNAVLVVLFGQLVSSAAIGHFSLFGATHTPVSPQRILGLMTMATGMYLAVNG